MRDIKGIVIHCSATPEDKYFDALDIKKWHTEGNGWSDIGYHYVVLLDGTIEKGRPINKTGAHVKGHNYNTIGVCYIGGINKDGESKDTRTRQQIESMSNLIVILKNIFGDITVKGHRDYPGVKKDCPCFNVSEWVENEGI